MLHVVLFIMSCNVTCHSMLHVMQVKGESALAVAELEERVAQNRYDVLI